MNQVETHSEKIYVVEPRKGWQIINYRELREYRDLIFFLVLRDIKVLYAQTILGYLWAILVPLIQIIIFTIIFGKVARLSSDGIPYLLFSSVAIIPWNYMSQAMSVSSQSLVAGQNLLGKVYFPRIIFPITPVLSKLLDFVISMIIIIAVCLFYKISPTMNLFLLPLFILMMVSLSAGVGLWLSALAIRFRDIKHAMPFVIRMLMYTAPIIYSASSIPEHFRILYSMNPLVSIIEGFRSCLLGTPFTWQFILPGIISNIIFLIGGAAYYNRMEEIFVDVI